MSHQHVVLLMTAVWFVMSGLVAYILLVKLKRLRSLSQELRFDLMQSKSESEMYRKRLDQRERFYQMEKAGNKYPERRRGTGHSKSRSNLNASSDVTSPLHPINADFSERSHFSPSCSGSSHSSGSSSSYDSGSSSSSGGGCD